MRFLFPHLCPAVGIGYHKKCVCKHTPDPPDVTDAAGWIMNGATASKSLNLGNMGKKQPTTSIAIKFLGNSKS